LGIAIAPTPLVERPLRRVIVLLVDRTESVACSSCGSAVLPRDDERHHRTPGEEEEASIIQSAITPLDGLLSGASCSERTAGEASA